MREGKLNSHAVGISIIDADTRQIITKDFYLKTADSRVGEICSTIIKHGKDTRTLTASTEMETCTFSLLESQVRHYGYDINSISGNVISVTLEPVSGIPFYPTSVDIILKKL